MCPSSARARSQPARLVRARCLPPACSALSGLLPHAQRAHAPPYIPGLLDPAALAHAYRPVCLSVCLPIYNGQPGPAARRGSPCQPVARAAISRTYAQRGVYMHWDPGAVRWSFAIERMDAPSAIEKPVHQPGPLAPGCTTPNLHDGPSRVWALCACPTAPPRGLRCARYHRHRRARNRRPVRQLRHSAPPATRAAAQTQRAQAARAP